MARAKKEDAFFNDKIRSDTEKVYGLYDKKCRQGAVDKQVADYQVLNNRAMQLADEKVHRIFAGIMTGALSVDPTYEDPKLIFLDQDEGDNLSLSMVWVSDIDYKPLDPNPMLRYLSPWLKDIYKGRFNKFMRHINNLTPEEIAKKLDMRESMMRYSAIFHVVKGAKELHPKTKKDSENESIGHIKILHKILELGGRVDIQDISGNSPLHICVSEVRGKPFTNKTTLMMARMLLEKGADPNIRNVWGRTPVVHACHETGAEYARLLLEFGADPTIKNTSGCDALFFASINNEEVARIFHEFDKKAVKIQRKVAKATGDLKKCQVCKSTAEKRCSGCFFAWYCGPNCQRGDWSSHKDKCETRRSEYIPLIGTFGAVTDKKESVYQVVRIQIMTDDSDGPTLHLSNKDGSMCGSLVPDFATPRLAKIIKSKGFERRKGYFCSFLKRGMLHVHPDILPPETW